MSLYELHTKALEEQVCNLTQDCYYLLSLLSQSDEIDWDSWPQGQKIKEHLKRSEDFFKQNETQKDKFSEIKRNRLLNTSDSELTFIERRHKNAILAAEKIKRREAEKKREAEANREKLRKEREYLLEQQSREQWARKNLKAAYEPPKWKPYWFWTPKCDFSPEEYFDYIFGDDF